MGTVLLSSSKPNLTEYNTHIVHINGYIQPKIIKPERKVPEIGDPHLPTVHTLAAIEYLKNPKNVNDRLYLRFLSNYNGDDIDKLILDWTTNQLHLEQSATPLKQIYPLLYVLDLRDYGWNFAAFSTVARRETYFREPLIDFNIAAELRALTGTEQDPETLHLESIVRADWFFRDTMESDRSPSYYDLLFAGRRFVPNINYNEYETYYENEDWAGGIDIRDGKHYPAGKYKVEKKRKVINSSNKNFKFIKFPANEKDFEKAFGVDKAFDFIKESGINPQRGAVVEGGEKKTSVVARQNRLIAFTNGPIGLYMKTFDVKVTAGKRDFAETLNRNFEFDVGEILTETPCGGLACLLVNKDGDITETADNRFATDNSDITFDARVRTPGSCFICHENGPIKPKDLVKEMITKGVDIKFKDKKDQINTRAFFLAWEKKLDFWQLPHIQLSQELFKGDPSSRAKTFKRYRDRYDEEIDLDKACIELWIPKEKFILAAAKSTKARINNLVAGISMPRRTWEIDGFYEMVKLLNSKEIKHVPPVK